MDEYAPATESSQLLIVCLSSHSKLSCLDFPFVKTLQLSNSVAMNSFLWTFSKFRTQFLRIFFLYVRNAPSSNPSSELNCLDFLFLKMLQVPNVSPLHLSSVIFGASAFVEDFCACMEQSVDRKGPGLKWFLFRTVWTRSREIVTATSWSVKFLGLIERDNKEK